MPSTAHHEVGQSLVPVRAGFSKSDAAARRPESVVIHEFLVKVGELGGFVVFEAEDLAVVRGDTTAFSSLNFQIEPVIDIGDMLAAVGVGIECRDSVV